MNDRSATISSAGPPISSGVSDRTLVRSCTRTRSSVPDRPGELAVPDVDRDHLAGTGPQQHVGETAGGRARVEASPALDDQPVGPKRSQRAGQLVPAAGHVVGGRIVTTDDAPGRRGRPSRPASPRPCRGPRHDRPRPARPPAPGSGPSPAGPARRPAGCDGPSTRCRCRTTWPRVSAEPPRRP